MFLVTYNKWHKGNGSKMSCPINFTCNMALISDKSYNHSHKKVSDNYDPEAENNGHDVQNDQVGLLACGVSNNGM